MGDIADLNKFLLHKLGIWLCHSKKKKKNGNDLQEAGLEVHSKCSILVTLHSRSLSDVQVEIGIWAHMSGSPRENRGL